MSGDFKVVHADTTAMANRFGTEAGELNKLHHLIAPLKP